MFESSLNVQNVENIHQSHLVLQYVPQQTLRSNLIDHVADPSFQYLICDDPCQFVLLKMALSNLLPIMKGISSNMYYWIL